MRWEEIEKELWGIYRIMADYAFRVMCRNPYQRLYLGYRPSTDRQWGDLSALPSHEIGQEGWQLAAAEPLPTNLTVEQLRAWVKDRCGQLPLIPSGKD